MDLDLSPIVEFVHRVRFAAAVLVPILAGTTFWAWNARDRFNRLIGCSDQYAPWWHLPVFFSGILGTLWMVAMTFHSGWFLMAAICMTFGAGLGLVPLLLVAIFFEIRRLCVVRRLNKKQ